jgi:murein DD-endopeptidase MepM/ murein hydrolase activator NlpD
VNAPVRDYFRTGAKGGSLAEFRLDQETRLTAALRGLKRWMTTERQIILRSKGQIRYVSVSRFRQVALGGIALAFAGWIGFSSASYFNMRGVIISRDQVIAKSEQAYNDLLNDVKLSRGRFIEIAGILENNHAHLSGLLQKNKILKSDLSTLRSRVRQNGVDKKQSDSHRRNLTQRISQLEENLKTAENRNTKLVGDLAVTETHLTTALNNGEEAGNLGDKLKSRINGMESRLADVRKSQRTLVSRITQSTAGDIKRLKRLIARTGLKPEKLMASVLSGRTGRGGPFIPLSGSDRKPSELDEALAILYGHIDRWDGLQQVIRRLPLASPVDHYYVASSYGKRRDPMNKKWSVHRGVDLAGQMRQKIRSVAPGRVKYAGWKGRFGRYIEIDHGHGIVTRYGHLRRLKVKRGQKVTHRQIIGLLGSSGRSTGPHLHYEILVNGKHVDPIKFVNAGKNVFKG